MAFPYKHVLLIGATSGIGRGMADRLAESGLKVTAVGRRQERLDEFVRMHGEDKASSVAFDLADIKAIPGFVERYRFTKPFTGNLCADPKKALPRLSRTLTVSFSMRVFSICMT
jgi:short-subunit dehydrogenase